MSHPPRTADNDRLESVRHWFDEAAHFLPTQGPIKVFVHHNTLHALEDLGFDEGVVRGRKIFGCEPYWTERQYHEAMSQGRIRTEDIEAVLSDDLGDEADRLIGSFGTRFALRSAMASYPLRSMPDRELHWLLAESDALRYFRSEVPADIREQTIQQTRQVVLSRLANADTEDGAPGEAFRARLHQLGLNDDELAGMKHWTLSQWEAFTLRWLWAICRASVQAILPDLQPPRPDFIRPRDWLLAATGIDTDVWVHEVLIRFSAAFLDQGFAGWQLPDREQGYLASFHRLYRVPWAVQPAWMQGLAAELAREDTVATDPNTVALQWIDGELQRMAIALDQRQEMLTQSLLALRGWAGMLYQTETNAPWTPRPAPAGTLLQFAAVRLCLDRLAAAYVARQQLQLTELSQLRDRAQQQIKNSPSVSGDGIAFSVFELAQFRRWLPHQLMSLGGVQWRELVDELRAFPSIERRRILHAAYERKYRVAAFDAIIQHAGRQTPNAEPRPTVPDFQVVTCIDDREESFRRHLEEIHPACETFGAAGFFAVVMYYRGAAEAHYRPLCPINVLPRHYVVEEPVFSATEENAKRLQRRRMLGEMTRQVHAGSRTATGGILTGLLGSLASFPLVARILAPRTASRLRDTFGGWVRPPATDLHLERFQAEPGPNEEGLGFTHGEMASMVARILQDIGLVKNFAPLILFLGHGSSSLNNPHESAYNCGACSGGRGGPNARAFAAMANDPQVRSLVAEQTGIVIPPDVRFVGGYHNTCDDRVEYFDLDELPRTHHPAFRRLETRVNEARCRNAHERCRRFESAATDLSPIAALAHVEERSEDLSQARPEYNHATNALCLVGQRSWSRGLFLDRRAFLVSYDPTIDTTDGLIIERILQAVIPVCGGISLEYYFSTVDPEGYGCGSKLPHNITALAGVMTGAASDLRPGLSAQMVEIHEPMRILFIVQTTAEIMSRIIRSNPAIERLVTNRWVQLAIFDAKIRAISLYRDQGFVPHPPGDTPLPRVATSATWYQGRRDHLGFAAVERGVPRD